MRQLFDIFKAEENEIYRPRFFDYCQSSNVIFLHSLLGVTLKKHLQLKRTLTATLALCIITHHM